MRQITLKKPVDSVSSLGGSALVVFAATLVCFMSAAPLSAQGSTNVFNDAVFWFRGGKDLNSDGYIQQGEFFDDLNADVESHANHTMTMSSSEYYKQDKFATLRQQFKDNAAFRSERVVFPALGTSIAKEMQTLHISDISVEYNDQPYYCPFSVNPHGLFARNNISNEYTIVSRIRLDDLEGTECLFRIGYNDSAKQGMTLGFAKHPSYAQCKYITGYRTQNSSTNNTSYQLDMRIPTNTWVDVAVVVGNGKLRVGVATPTSYSKNYPSIAFAETPMWTEHCELLAETYYSLFCFKNISSVGGSDQLHFSGSVQQLAIWGRALNEQEVMAAFGMPRPTLFRTGFDNGESNEFGGIRSGATQTIDGLGSWQNIANTMKAGDTWTVNFTALRDEANLPQIFSIKALPDSTTALIEPILNGTSLGEGRVSADSRAFWPVATNIVHDGENELVITRKDVRTRDFLMDAMELSGSLGVGMVDGSIDDGRTDPACTATGVPSAADPNTQHWPQDLQPYSGITNLHLRVWVDPDIADRASFTFKTKVQSSNSPTKNMTGKEFFNVYINNASVVKCTTAVSASGLDWSREFSPGDLHGGWNDIEFVCPGPYDTCRWYFDYFRFEGVLPEPFGFSQPHGLSVFIR